MIATSIWVNQQRIAGNINVTIGKRNIYVDGEHITKDSKICIFTQIKELKEIAYIDLIYTEINNIIVRDCKYFVIQDGCINFMNKEDNLVAHVRLYDVEELCVKTSDGVMFIADKQ